MEVPGFELINLFIVVDGSAGDHDVRAIKDVAEDLASAREWIIEPPRFVDQMNADVRECGIALRMHTAYGAHGERLPPDVDRVHLGETVAVLEAIAGISHESGTVFVVELDNDQVGSIANGELDNSLRIGLIDEWQRVLES